MHDQVEYPGYVRHHLWVCDEEINALEVRFSPIFDIDRSMGVSEATTPRPPHRAAPTGADLAGRNEDMFRTIPIGVRIIAHFTELQGLASSAPTFELWASCAENVNPITERLLASIPIPIGGVLALDSFVGFPYIQARVVSQDFEASVTICGAFRVLPA